MYKHTHSIEDGQPLISIHNVSKKFKLHTESQRSIQESVIRFFQRKQHDKADTFWALRDVNFEVERGDCIGLIGPNGSGKSTLLKLITGIIEPTVGSAEVRGRMSSLLELGAGFHPDLTGRENIFLNASIYGLSGKQIRERLEPIIEFSEIGNFIDTPVKHYSSGMYVRLGFAVAMHTDPDILLVDEVLAVGDQHFQNKCIDAVMEFRRRGGTLIFVSHGLGNVQNICNRAIWFDKGVVQADDSPIDVIMEYRNRVAEEENAATAQAETDSLTEERRWGTGDVEIVNVELRDQSGAQRTVFYTGDRLSVQIDYVAKQRMENPTFGIAIYHQNGAHITGPNTQTFGLDIPSIEGAGTVTYSIPSLPLIDGAYLLTVAATDQTGAVIYDFHDRHYPFRVSPGNTQEQYGLVALGGEWQIDAPDRLRSTNGSINIDSTPLDKVVAQ